MENFIFLSWLLLYINTARQQQSILQKDLKVDLCKDVESLNDFGCPKNSKLLENDNAEWNCSNCQYRQKKIRHCAEKKAYVYGIWTLIFLIIFNVCIRDCNLLYLKFFSEFRVVL